MSERSTREGPAIDGQGASRSAGRRLENYRNRRYCVVMMGVGSLHLKYHLAPSLFHRRQLDPRAAEEAPFSPQLCRISPWLPTYRVLNRAAPTHAEDRSDYLSQSSVLRSRESGEP